MINKPYFQLSRNAFGRLVFTGTDGVAREGIIPVRAFPITAPDRGIALIDQGGHELAWIDQLRDLPDESRMLVGADLASREFIPEIKRIHNVSSFATPSVWHVETDRGKTAFILKGEEGIRRLSSPSLLIADSHGIHFLIRDRFTLDHHSRKILDNFL
ncbi:MAG: DUF1854 domain-containing protein [Nitrosospira sp.]